MYPNEIFPNNEQVASALVRSFKPTIRGASECTVKDDRSEEQKKTHVLAVVATDKGMSGWGGARGGISRCAWSFDPNAVNSDRLFNWVKSRSDMSHVNLIDLRDYRPNRRTSHFHIYICNPGHPGATY